MQEMVMGSIVIGASLLFGLVAIIFLLQWLRHMKLRIRDSLSKTAYVQDFWMMRKKDKESGIMYWKSVFWQPKIEVEKPPDAAIDVGAKGRKYVEAYKLSEDEFIWIADVGLEKGEILVDSGKKWTDTFKPFSVVQRDTLISQFKKADEINKGKWTPDKIVAAAAIGSMVCIILALFVFWGDIAKPSLDSHRLALEVSRQNTKISQQNMQIMQGGKIPQEPKAQVSNVVLTKTEEPPKKKKNG